MYEQDRHTFAMACLFLALLLALMYVIATPSRSQVPPTENPCAPTANVTKMLKDKYGETPAIAAITDDNSPMLIFSNPKTGTFTVTIRRPGGLTCLMTGGNSWTPVEQEKEGTDI